MSLHKILCLICCFAISVYSKTTIMVVLGCAIQEIQQERVSAAVEYASALDKSNITWFVTGGVKNDVSEAAQMKEQISETKDQPNVVLDEKARNTAENFAYLKKWLVETYDEKKDFPQIVITTSEFHRERASKIFDGIFHDVPTNYKWNLSKTNSCNNCWNDEIIHMRNVVNDVKNAQHIL